MAIVNKKYLKAKSIENFADFAFSFSQGINWHAFKFGKVKVIFDQ